MDPNWASGLEELRQQEVQEEKMRLVLQVEKRVVRDLRGGPIALMILRCQWHFTVKWLSLRRPMWSS